VPWVNNRIPLEYRGVATSVQMWGDRQASIDRGLRLVREALAGSRQRRQHHYEEHECEAELFHTRLS
jgi:hypothetical protein